jgi:UDP-2-acetamido-2-deoxy-ribo-hexuluronate aminotransferase
MSKPVIPFIDLKSQYAALRTDIDRRIRKVLDHGQYIMGPEVNELEERLADYVGVRHCIAASSGTDTLLMALMALDVRPGDEVITTPFSFIATAEVIVLLGARPVFVDIDPRTYNIDAKLIEPAITPRTKAIMPVSLYGQCADMDAINIIASRHHLPVIEDGAQSFGATYKGRRSCGLSTLGSTSFFPSKPLGCYGDGGALFTNDDVLARILREIRVHGQDRRYHHARVGLNARMDTLQAAVLLAKIERFDWEVDQRSALGARYTAKISASCSATECCLDATLPPGSCPGGITVPFVASDNTSVFAQYTIRIPDRDAAASSLSNAGIPTAVHYPIPLHLQPAFSHLNVERRNLAVAEKVSGEVLSLPFGPDLPVETQDFVIDALLDACNQR